MDVCETPVDNNSDIMPQCLEKACPQSGNTEIFRAILPFRNHLRMEAGWRQFGLILRIDLVNLVYTRKSFKTKEFHNSQWAGER